MIEPKIREITLENKVDDSLHMELTSILLIIVYSPPSDLNFFFFFFFWC